jgi:transposase
VPEDLDLFAKGLAMVAHCSARSIQVSIAGRRATPASGERLVAKPLFIGIDVSKSWIDIADPCGRALRVANEETAIAATFKGPWSSGTDMVCEATGGCERALMRVAKQRGLPLRRVHPNRARAFGQMTARLAKTDALDARMLAEFAAFTAVSRASPCRPPRR